MAKNCIGNYYNCLDTYKAIGTTDKAFWMEYTSALIAYLHNFFSPLIFYLSEMKIITLKNFFSK